MQSVHTDMNHVAERLTGWTLEDARGQLLSTDFTLWMSRVVSRRRAGGQSPPPRTIVGLANHTSDPQRGETPIDDSGAPIRETMAG